MEPSVWFDLFQKVSGPIFAYIVGVEIAVRIKLYGDLKREHVYLMALPVGLIQVGILIWLLDVIWDNEVIYYDYTQPIVQYLTVCGFAMFYGTIVPEMFAFYRKMLLLLLKK